MAMCWGGGRVTLSQRPSRSWGGLRASEGWRWSLCERVTRPPCKRCRLPGLSDSDAKQVPRGREPKVVVLSPRMEDKGTTR